MPPTIHQGGLMHQPNLMDCSTGPAYSYRRSRDCAAGWTTATATAPTVHCMAAKMPPAVWVPALVVGVIQVAGSFGAADNQPERRAVDAIAVALALVGPVALLARRRAPLATVAVSMGAALVFLGRGHPYGPIFLSVIVALFSAVVLGHRRATWAIAGAGL